MSAPLRPGSCLKGRQRLSLCTILAGGFTMRAASVATTSWRVHVGKKDRAVGGVIQNENDGKIRAAMIVEGANMPITCRADPVLRKRGYRDSRYPGPCRRGHGLFPGVGTEPSALPELKNRVNQRLGDRMQKAGDEVNSRVEQEILVYRQAP